MRTSQLFLGAIVLGVIAIIIGVLFFANVFGTHPTRAYTALGIGAVLVIIGIIGIVVARPRRGL